MVWLWRFYLPLPQRGLTGHMLSFNYMKVPTICPSQEINTSVFLPQGKAESPSGQISQLKICQLLSTRPSVVFPVGLNGGDQSVTVDLPKSLHTGSSVTTDEHPYIKVNIPMPILEEQDHASPPLGEKCDIPTINRPKNSLET